MYETYGRIVLMVCCIGLQCEGMEYGEQSTSRPCPPPRHRIVSFPYHG